MIKSTASVLATVFSIMLLVLFGEKHGKPLKVEGLSEDLR